MQSGGCELTRWTGGLAWRSSPYNFFHLVQGNFLYSCPRECEVVGRGFRDPWMLIDLPSPWEALRNHDRIAESRDGRAYNSARSAGQGHSRCYPWTAQLLGPVSKASQCWTQSSSSTWHIFVSIKALGMDRVTFPRRRLPSPMRTATLPRSASYWRRRACPACRGRIDVPSVPRTKSVPMRPPRDSIRDGLCLYSCILPLATA